jgi:hypothetical protein
MKQCSACGQEKPLEAFARRSKATGALQSKCRVCAREYANEWYRLNRKDICAKRVAKYRES